MNKNKKLRPNQAKVQFLAIKKEILELFEKGHSMQEALEILLQQEKISMTYQTFRRYVLKFLNIKSDIPTMREYVVTPKGEKSSISSSEVKKDELSSSEVKEITSPQKEVISPSTPQNQEVKTHEPKKIFKKEDTGFGKKVDTDDLF